MTDRVPTKPGRVKLTKEDGTVEYAVLERADEPTQEGTPINKATLLSDATAAMLGGCSTPDGCFARLSKAAGVQAHTVETDAITPAQGVSMIAYGNGAYVAATKESCYVAGTDRTADLVTGIWCGDSLETLAPVMLDYTVISESYTLSYIGINKVYFAEDGYFYLIGHCTRKTSKSSYSSAFLAYSVNGKSFVMAPVPSSRNYLDCVYAFGGLYLLTQEYWGDDGNTNQIHKLIDRSTAVKKYGYEGTDSSYYKNLYKLAFQPDIGLFIPGDYNRTRGFYYVVSADGESFDEKNIGSIGFSYTYYRGDFIGLYPDADGIKLFTGFTGYSPNELRFAKLTFTNGEITGSVSYTPPFNTVLVPPAWNGHIFSTVNVSGTTATCYRSTDGENWESTTLTLDNPTWTYNAAVWCKDKFYLPPATNTFHIFSSADGLNYGAKRDIVLDQLIDLDDRALEIPDSQIHGAVRALTGFYKGTGNCGSSFPNSLRFPFTPMLVIVARDSSTGEFPAVTFVNGQTGAVGLGYPSNTIELQNFTVNWTRDGVDWSSTKTADNQMNVKNALYYYFALGL